MRRYLVLASLLFACAAHAGGGTLRVGSEVLSPGDSATRVIELLGKPSYRGHAKAPSSRSGGKKGAKSSSSSGGEQWQYRQGNRIVTIVLANGKVTSIRDDGR
ncbi:DUF2845 domain-containing protein [Dyella sp. C11]|uniref:DUF2845 domain-containing protein n=1 Tax=Dyella sp. C11 TaxID=2126991 RepID=UPI000D64503B|nr:DUF2845 domain-containing protein [Dyella sp. C11]